ncbi:MAG: VOC family protein [Chloroflexi bacterium]|nr:VOC family protein [Chloroflexota bacterium]
MPHTAPTVGHVGLVVRDMDRMRDFYIRVAGLRETRAATLEGPHIDELTGLSGVTLEAVFLGTDERPEAVELLKYHNHPDASPARGPSGNGPNHVQFVVDELDPIVDALRAEGLDAWGGPVDWPRLWRRVLYAKDPEGNVVEFNERLPDVRHPGDSQVNPGSR